MSNQKIATIRKLLDGMVIFLAVTTAGVGVVRHAKHVNHVFKENKELRQYATLAHDFAENIKPDIINTFGYCTDTNCMTCRAVRNGNERALKDYNTAINTLNINTQKLDVLRQGPAGFTR